MRLTRQNRASRAATAVLLTIIATVIACADAVTSVKAPRAAGSGERIVDEGTVSLWSIAARTNGTFISSPRTEAANVVLRGGRPHLAVSSISGAARAALASRPDSVAHVLSPTIPRNGKQMAARVLSKQQRNGRQITVLAVDDDDRGSGKPAQLTLTLVDGRPVSATLPRYKRVQGKWALDEATTTTYDARGHARLATKYKFNGGRGTANTVGEANGSSLRRVTTSLASFARAAADALAPVPLEAQADPCGILYNVMIQEGALAAEMWLAYAGMQDLCDAAMLEDPEAAILICLDAQLDKVDAQNQDLVAIGARFDYQLCLIDNIQVLPEVVIVGNAPKDCYDQDVWVPDPDEEDNGWWETEHVCEYEQ